MSDTHYFSRLLQKNLWIYFFSFLIAPLGYIGKVLISDSMSVSDVGAFYAVISLIGIFGAYNDFGMSESLNYFLPGYLHEKNTKKITQTFSIALTTNVLTSTILAIGLFFGADVIARSWIGVPYVADVLRIFIVFFFADNVARTCGIFFQAIQDTKIQKLTEFMRSGLLMILIIILWKSDNASMSWYSSAYAASVVIGVAVSLTIIGMKYRRYFSKDGWYFTKKDYMHVLKYAFWVMLAANVGVLLSQVDMQMIVLMLGVEAAGYYTNYLSMMRIPFMFLLPGVYFLFPVFSDLIKRGEIRKIQKIHGFCYELFTILALMMTSFFWIFGDELTQALFGPLYGPSARILLFSSPFLLFNFLLQIDFQILSASGKPRTKMYILLIGLGINIVTNYICIKMFGLDGAAFAVGIGWICIWGMSFFLTREYVRDFRWSVFLRNAVGIALISWILTFFDIMSYTTSRWGIFIGIIGAITVYGIAFLALNIGEVRRFRGLFALSKNPSNTAIPDTDRADF